MGMGNFRFMPDCDVIENGSYKWMVWAQDIYSQNSNAHRNSPYSSFVIKPIDMNNHESGYRIYVNRGYNNPVMIANKTDPIWFTKVLCSTVQMHGIGNPEKSTWYFDEKLNTDLTKKTSNDSDRISAYEEVDKKE